MDRGNIAESEAQRATMVETLYHLAAWDSKLLYQAFQDTVESLHHELDELVTVSPFSREARLHKLMQQLAALDKLVIDIAPRLPGRDQESYLSKVRMLQAALRSITNSKRGKFKFKTPRQEGSVGESGGLLDLTSGAPHNNTAVVAGDRNQSVDSVAQDQKSHPHENYYKVTNLVDERLYLPVALSAVSGLSGEAKPLTLSNLTRCVVSACSHASSSASSSTSPLAALPNHPIRFPMAYLKSITSSVVDCGVVSGSVFIVDVCDSAIFIAAHQVRIHNTTNTAIICWADSKPIVENCRGIRFIEMDEEWVKWIHEASGTQFTKDPIPGGAGGKGIVKNMWSEVEDFNWLKDGPSPSWTVDRTNKFTFIELSTFLTTNQKGREEILQRTGIGTSL